MSDLTAESLAAALEPLGWRTVEAPTPVLGPLLGVFESSFGVAGFARGKGVFRKERAWRVYQEALADVIAEGFVAREKDRYLVFLVQEVSKGDYIELERALADTHVARKLCVEVADDMERALSDSVVIGGPRVIAEATSGNTGSVLSERVLSDLSGRSASRVLDGLLAGRYGEQK